ncbi:MAG TPA: hypothetical protein VK195_00320, partial [Burkholderiaceae bacterium]|nr:hypothetical protein [Burkholderiaceae bacterium]
EAKAGEAQSQIDLFAAPPEPVAAVAEATHPALDALHDLDPDALSPREALEQLYKLKQLVRA